MKNRISTKTYLNTFSGKNFYIIEIDGKSLEDIILEKYPEITQGIVPTLLNWLEDEEERKVVWNRVLPDKLEKSNLPILMCSEDIDLWCTLIMVEVETDENHVYWNRFGLEVSDAQNPNEIGKSINWFSGIPKMVFDKNEYECVLEEFRSRLDEKQDYHSKASEIVNEYKIR